MPYVTSIERLALEKEREQGIEQGIEQGREQGLLDGIESVLEIRFGADASSIVAKIRQLSNVEVLEQVLHASKTVDRPEDLAQVWAGKAATPRHDDIQDGQ